MEENLNTYVNKVIDIFGNETGMIALHALSINISLIIYACSKNSKEQKKSFNIFKKLIENNLKHLSDTKADPEKIDYITLKRK